MLSRPSVLKTFLSGLVFFVLGLLIYSNTFESPFIFDDVESIAENADIRINELSVENILKAGFGKDFTSSRPVGYISFALNYYFHQYQLKGYHIVNIVIHILTGIFLFSFIKSTITLPSVNTKRYRPDTIAFFAVLIWFVNPIQTQSVAYIVQRFSSLSAMFCILSFLFYLKGRLAVGIAKRWAWFIGAGLAWILALGCKQNAAILPFLIYLYEWYFFQNLSKKWLRRSFKYLLVVFILFGLVAFISLGSEPLEKVKNLRDFSEGQFTMGQRLLTQTRVVNYYLSLIFYPHPSRLNLDYDFPLSYSLINPLTTLFSLTTIIGLLILGVVLARKERLISFCIFWFFGNLVIESTVIPLAIIFEHRLYMPSMLLFLIPIHLCFRYIKLNWLRSALLCIIVVVLCVWTYQRNRVWQTDLSLWTDVVKKSPNKARPRLNLGKSLLELGQTDAAIKHYKEAIRLKPDYEIAHHNLGNAMIIEGKFDMAIKHFAQALDIDPDFAEAHGKLGFALAKQGKTNQAIPHYLKAVKIKPDYAPAHLNLGVALSERGDTDQAISRFYRALKIDPDLAEAHYNLAIALEARGKTNDAIHHYSLALEIDPENANIPYNLGNILAKQARTDEAIVYYKKALSIQPDHAQALGNLAFLYAADKQYDESLKLLKKMAALQPNNSSTHYNIAALYALQNNVSESIKWLKQAIDRGYQNWDQIKNDKDLDSIRNSPDYRQLIMNR